MWQIGVLARKPCTFSAQNGSFSAFWHYKNKERLSRGLDVNWHIPSTCLDASRKWFSPGIYSINRASGWLWPENEETPENGQNVRGFQVKTPICHIAPVSHAYPYIPPKRVGKKIAEYQPPPRKGGFSKGGFCRVRCRNQGNEKHPRILGPAAHLPLKAPQPREAYIFAKTTPSKTPLFLIPENISRHPGIG